MQIVQIEAPEIMQALKKLEAKVDAITKPFPLDYMTVDQYATYLGVSEQTVRARIKAGAIKVQRGKRPYRILIEQLG